MNKSTRSRQPAKREDVATEQTGNQVLKSPFLWGVVLVVAAAIIAVIITNPDDPVASSQSETGFAEIIGSPLPRYEEPDVAIGAFAPSVSAETIDGDRVIVGEDTTARLIGFFAHWCPHCQREVPRVTSWLESNTLPDGVEVVAISTAVDASRGNYPPSAWFERENWPTQVLLDDDSGTLANGFGLNAFPYWVAVDGQGVVVARVSGGIDDATFGDLIAAITP